mmetsp:Transcript_33082/g.94536  ORF Transcript_33082/g.94536 Transcript_33082/m.94536 type:complete len:270 (-) Transcript_33082:272-1081(-)
MLLVCRRIGVVSESEIHVCDPKTLRVAHRPLKIVHERPGEIAPYVYPILVDGSLELGSVIEVVAQALCVLYARGRGVGQHRPTALRDINNWRIVSAIDPIQQLAEPKSTAMQPGRLPLLEAIGLNVSVSIQPSSDAFIVVRNPIGPIMIESEKIRAPVNELALLLCEPGQSVSQESPQLRRVVASAREDGLGKPPHLRKPHTLPRRHVLRICGARLAPVLVERDPDDASLRLLEIAPIQLDRSSMCQEHVVSGNVAGILLEGFHVGRMI